MPRARSSAITSATRAVPGGWRRRASIRRRFSHRWRAISSCTEPKTMASGRYTQFTLYRRLLIQARPYWIHIAGTLLLNLLSAPLALLTPLPMKLAVDTVIGGHAMPAFLRTLAPRAVESSNWAMLVVICAL